MLNKILVFGGLSITAILVIENMVVSNISFVLWDNASSSWMLSVVSTIVGIAIGYGIKGISLEGKETDDDNYDF